MALSKLINNQKIIIDNHNQGCRVINNWDEQSSDIHIDKMTNYKIEGRKQKVRIRIPINSERPLRIENARRQVIQKVPNELLREINQAFEDNVTRTNFVTEVLDVLENFATALSSKERAIQVLTNISRHFGLNWTAKEVLPVYANEALSSLTLKYRRNNEDVYFSKIDHEKIELGQYERIE